MNSQSILSIGFYSLISIILSLTACKEKEPTDRERIIFKDPVPVVEDSIKSMLKLIERLPEPKEQSLNNYIIVRSENTLLVNGQSIGKLDELKDRKDLSVIPELANYNEKEALQFVRLAIYLRENLITSAYREPVFNQFIFNYRPDKYNESQLRRNIIVIDEANSYFEIDYESFLNFYDKKGSLILFGWNL